MITPPTGDTDLAFLTHPRGLSIAIAPCICRSLSDALDVLRTRPVDTVVWDARIEACQKTLDDLTPLAQQTHGAAIILISPPLPYAEGVLEAAWHQHTHGIYAVLRADALHAKHTWEPLLRHAFEHTTRTRQMQTLRTKWRAREDAWDLVARGGHGGVWHWDLLTDRMEFSPRWKQLIGYAPDEIGQHPKEWLQRVHPEDLPGLKNQIDMHRDGLSSHLQHEYRLQHKDGTYRWMLCRGLAQRDGQGRVIRMAGTQSDISPQRIAELRLVHDAFHDRLTGLPNRALFMERLERAASAARRNPGYQYAIVLLDIDRFKNVNDSLGHHRGDQLLLALVERIRGCLRKMDTLARLSSDEFTVLLDGIRSTHEAMHIAELLHAALAAPFQLGEHDIFASSSIGIAVSDSAASDDPTTVLRHADTALHSAKIRGYARYELFDPATHHHDVRLLTLENQLRHAIDREAFVLHYQPIIDLTTHTLAGVEALVRWQADDGRLIPPMEFIALAEETGLIIPIGNWVMREAFRQMVMWQQQFDKARHIHLSLNISPKQFLQAGFVGLIKRSLRTAGLDASSVHLEITETILVENLESTVVMMHDLKAMGLHLSIDDFGTGYSSLRSLHRFPLASLKIDRSFVADIATDPSKNAILHTIVALAELLGVDVIAEGIETPEQLAYLARLKCRFGQGFLFAKPMLPADLECTYFKP